MSKIRFLRSSLHTSCCKECKPLKVTMKYIDCCDNEKCTKIKFDRYPRYGGINDLIVEGVKFIVSLSFSQYVQLKVTYASDLVTVLPCTDSVQRVFCGFGPCIKTIFIQDGFFAKDCQCPGNTCKILEKTQCGYVPTGIVNIHTEYNSDSDSSSDDEGDHY